jgi:hypothetical protein
MIQQEVEILRDLEDLDSITKTIQTRYKNGWIVSAMTSLPWNRDVVITFIKIKDYSPVRIFDNSWIFNRNPKGLGSIKN